MDSAIGPFGDKLHHEATLLVNFILEAFQRMQLRLAYELCFRIWVGEAVNKSCG